ncbi:MAG: glycosyltransferase [Absicoccus sp.]|uniref:glycosyltransferase n=1 Tax=Absicoccus sp. TaxID=2718527 RepID=UPI002A7473B5|nr:glycosyltransferase [Absicoccus sp.]MDY3036443.1 glycosyltransferase [Absicoccus sp.]
MKETSQKDVLLKIKKDRRLLSHVPDPTGQRQVSDRRGQDEQGNKDLDAIIRQHKKGIRYITNFSVSIIQEKTVLKALCMDISDTGLLLQLEDEKEYEAIKGQSHVKLKFQIPPGVMPEGRESRYKLSASVVRSVDETRQIGLQFLEDLGTYDRRRKDRYLMFGAALSLAFVSFCVVLMRMESFIYFRYHTLLYAYSIIAATFLLTRYLFGMFYKPVPIDPTYTPSVTIVIPCFNEEEWIQITILSCIDQNYPVDKLKVIVVDDCSTDRSVEKIKEIIDYLKEKEGKRYQLEDRLSYFVQPQNAGKRAALSRGVENTDTDLVMFVDSDSFLDPYAVRNIVQPFREPKMGGCAGRCDVANTYTNSLTKMQSVRYYTAFRIMKAAEALFDTVTCLSGPLSCYRRDIVMEYKDNWVNQTFLGHKATFGDDRSMTNFVLSHHQCSYQDTAVCSTIVPKEHKVFLKQQMRWKRSWLRESLMAGKFMWRKEPFAMINFYIGLIVPMLAPIVVVYNFFYVPLTQHVFPTTFLIGLLLMAMMMSFSQLLLRKSTTWLFGFWFCLYYELVLLWQMPIAWFTFWKSTWGTRMTPSDVQAEEKKRAKKEMKRKKAENET